MHLFSLFLRAKCIFHDLIDVSTISRIWCTVYNMKFWYFSRCCSGLLPENNNIEKMAGVNFLSGYDASPTTEVTLVVQCTWAFFLKGAV